MFQDYFSVAVKFGHQAFKYLGEVYRKYRHFTVQNYKEMSPDRQTEIAQDMIHHYIIATLSFEFMMEAIIHNFIHKQYITTPKLGDDFDDMWKKAFDEKQLDKNSIVNFLQNFWQSVRYDIMHSQDIVRYRLTNFRFKKLYGSFYYGWQAFALLSDAVRLKHDNNSWKTVCKMNNIPDTINDSVLNQIDDVLNHEKYKYTVPPLNFLTIAQGALKILAEIHEDYKSSASVLTVLPSPTQALQDGTKLQLQGKQEQFDSLLAIVVFHAAVESFIQSLCKKLNIKCNKNTHTDGKLQKLSEKLSFNEAQNNKIDQYVDFYKKYRHGFIHPKQENKYLEFIKEYKFSLVYQGLQAGWETIFYLLNADHITESTELSVQEWQKITNQFYLPSPDQLPQDSLMERGSSLMKFHLVYFRIICEKRNGETCFYKKNYAQAIIHFQSANDEALTHPIQEIKELLVCVKDYLGANYQKLKQYDKALQCFDEALNLHQELAGKNSDAYKKVLTKRKVCYKIKEKQALITDFAQVTLADSGLAMSSNLNELPAQVAHHSHLSSSPR